MSRISLISKTGMEVAIITAVDAILFEARSRQKQIVALIREMVECESPSDDPAAVNRFVDLLGDVAPSFAASRRFPADASDGTSCASSIYSGKKPRDRS